MTRFVSVLSLLASAGLLVVWLVTPATSAPPQQPLAVVTAMDQVLPIVADVNAQVDRLRERLNVRTDYPPPSRDPFRFAAPSRPATVAPPTRSTLDSTPLPAEAPPALRLVAILTNDTNRAATTRRAVLSSPDDDIHFVSTGDAIGGYVVAAVQDDAVVLTDARSGASVRLTLR